jgi:O-methyltransferase
VCELVGRRLEIFDSFQGLPVGEPTDREARHYRPGDYCGTMEEVRDNIGKYGALACCHLNPGWFQDTLPEVNYPIVLAFLDVDYEASLDVCVRSIWPQLVNGGYIFLDECQTLDYVSLFYSENWWRVVFNETPPGLIGGGSGLALGEYYIGPWHDSEAHPLQHITTGAYTRKGMSAHWTYRPASTATSRSI